MLERVDAESLVLLDELGAGTDPIEGSALARAIIAELLTRGPLVIATSHYAELKSFAYTTPGVTNASVEFDVETLAPTYRLTIGTPGRSNALAIASRLGLAPVIIEAARALLSHEQVRVEELLTEVRADRDRAAAELRHAEEARTQVERERDALAEERGRLQAEQAAAVARAAAAFAHEIATLREDLRRLAQERDTVAVTKEWLQQAQARAAKVAADFQTASASRRHEAQQRPAVAVQAGDRVQVHSLGQQGEVVEIVDGSALVQLGSFRLRLPTSDLSRLPRGQTRRAGSRDWQSELRRHSLSLPPAPIDVPLEVDMRGLRVHEVEPTLDRMLNDATLGNLPSLRIIHGKGTGALRQVVRDYLRAHPLVERLETPPANQGGDGVTVATFKA